MEFFRRVIEGLGKVKNQHQTSAEPMPLRPSRKTGIWFHVPLTGSLPALYCGLMLFLLSCVGFGLFISSLAVTQQQGMLGAFLSMVPAIILSGFATPIANMPPVIQAITLIDPLRISWSSCAKCSSKAPASTCSPNSSGQWR
jgi:hypothetical protein